MYKILLTIYLLSFSLLSANILQKAIDDAPAGSILKLPAGVYKGNIVIDKPITIIGKEDGVILDAENKGTVITVESSFVTIKNLKVMNSGDMHHNLDGGIVLKECNNCEVSNCVVENCLFGIDLQMVNNSIMFNNKISSKDVALGLRGDGMRLWYSNDNIIKKNSLIKSRDMVVWYSHGNEIIENYGEYCRYSLHFIYAGKNYVRDIS
ncbi:MAG: right-handed parallel beta-helix repeat-containing protein, partial [Sulfurimonas sp.]|nr:right-handed parallel beta-helix repeat-containing protein [Sulfurimonas sp.]